MDFSFIIVTDGSENARLRDICSSIVSQNIPKYEIIIVGDPSRIDQVSLSRIEIPLSIIPFDETIKKAWITRKKNLGAQKAKYENLVFMHDYFYLLSGWYEGWLKWCSLGNTFDVANNIILNREGTRHSDWVVDPYLMWDIIPETRDTYDVLLPYMISNLTPIQYISGGYWISTREFALNNPQNEDLTWGQAEDIEFSRRIRQKTTFKMNIYSAVKILKPGKWAPNFISDDRLHKMMDAAGITASQERHIV